MDEGLLVTLVQQYPNLYDKKRKDFKNIQVRENSWSQISDAMEQSVEECQRVFKNIRDRYGREKRKRQTVPTGTESQVEEQTWALYDSLGFLAEHIKSRKTSTNVKPSNSPSSSSSEQSSRCSSAQGTTSPWNTMRTIMSETTVEDSFEREVEYSQETFNMSQDEEATSSPQEPTTPTELDSQEETDQHQTPKGTTSKRTRRSTEKAGLEVKLQNMAETVSSYLLAQQSQVDSDQAFAQYVAAVLKEQDKKTKSKIKVEILNILSKYDEK